MLVATDKNLGVALICKNKFKQLEKKEIAKLSALNIALPEDIVVKRLKAGVEYLLKRATRLQLPGVFRI